MILVLVIGGSSALVLGGSEPAASATSSADSITITGPAVTVTVPVGPTVTIKIPPITLPPIINTVTETARVPGPTRTVFLDQPGPTVFKTVTSQPSTRTVTADATAEATVTATATQTVSPSGQPSPSDGTVEPPDPLTEFIDSPGAVIGISTLTILILIGLIVFGLWLGYAIGYKDADRENGNFMAAMSDLMMIRGKHE